MLSLASLILVGGALGDRLGRRRTYLVGVAGFAVASVLCAFAESPVQLVVFRLVQGVAAALLTPGGLALIQGTFRRGTARQRSAPGRASPASRRPSGRSSVAS